jgi:hypothetical protein
MVFLDVVMDVGVDWFWAGFDSGKLSGTDIFSLLV